MSVPISFYDLYPNSSSYKTYRTASGRWHLLQDGRWNITESLKVVFMLGSENGATINTPNIIPGSEVGRIK